MVADSDPRPPPPDDARHAWEAPAAPPAAPSPESSPLVDLDAEREVLGTVFAAPQTLATIRETVTPGCWSTPMYAGVYQAMCTIADDGGDPSDLHGLLRVLSSSGGVSSARWLQSIGELSDRVGHTANLPRYIAAVAAASQRRAIVDVAQWVVAEGSGLMEDQEAWAEGLAERFRGLGSQRRTVKLHSSADGMREALEHIKRAATEEGYSSGVDHGFKDLAKHVKNFGNGHLVILSGQPGSGKTSLATNVADRVADGGKRVDVYSLEMAGLDLNLRRIAGRARIGLTQLREGEIQDDDWPRLVTAMDDLSTTPLNYSEDSGLTAAQIVASITAEFRTAPGDEKPALIVIDYLQFMKVKSARTREEELNKTVHLLKALAKVLNVPILLLSSMNRDNKGGAPKMSDLRGSGAIEFAADTVIMLWAPDPAELSRRDAVIAKARHGSQGSVQLYFAGSYCRFSDHAVKWGG